MKDVTAIILRTIIMFESIVSLIIWILKYREFSSINMKIVSMLMGITSIGFIVFSGITMLNHNAFEIDPLILNVASNTIRIIAMSSVLVSGLFIKTEKKSLDTLSDGIKKIVSSKSE